MPDLYPLLLLPDFRERVWGARDLSPIYPNHKVEAEPIGEVWLTGDECRVANGPLAGQTLGDLARRFGRELVGEAAPDPHRFPLLVKFLFPREKLSVQVHPDDETARRSGLPHGKSECWYVVSAEIDAQVGLGLKPGTVRSDFESAVRRGERADALLNWIYVKPGELIYNPAGTLHCIGPGSVLLEVQQNSDVTYRLYDYGRPRELHLEQGLAAMKEQTAAGKVRAETVDWAQVLDLPQHVSQRLLGKRAKEVFALLASEHFTVLRFEVGSDGFIDLEPTRMSPSILIAVNGAGRAKAGKGPAVTFARGDTVVIPAGLRDLDLSPQWELDCLLVGLGSPELPEPEASPS